MESLPHEPWAELTCGLFNRKLGHKRGPAPSTSDVTHRDCELRATLQMPQLTGLPGTHRWEAAI